MIAFLVFNKLTKQDFNEENIQNFQLLLKNINCD